MEKACIHFQNINFTKSEQHNRREIFLNYTNPTLKQFNEHWELDSVESRHEEIKSKYFQHFGKKQPSNAQPIHEAVVLIKNGTTMEDLHHLNKLIEKEVGIHAFQIHIHRDEGHHDNNGRWQPNLHAHIAYDMTNKETGKRYWLAKEDMVKIQDIVAEELGMERGESKEITNRKHIDPIVFKIMKEQERIDLLRIDKEFYDNLCAEAKEIKEKAGIDITETLGQCLKKSSSFEEYKILLADQNIEVKEVKNKKNETELIYDASKVKTTNSEKILFETALPLKYRYQGLAHFEALKKGKKVRSEFNQKMFVSGKIKTCKEESNSFNEFLQKAKAAGIEVVPQYKKDKIIGYEATAPEFANAITFHHRELRKECHAYFLFKSFEQKDAPSKPETKKYSVPQQATILKRLMGKAAKEMTSVDHFFELLEESNVKVHKNLTAGKATGYSIELGDTDNAKVFKSSQIDRNLSISKLKVKVQKEESKSKEIIPSDKGLVLEPTPKEHTKTADKQPDKATPKQTIPVNLSVDDQKLAIENLCIEAKKESKSIDDFISILATKDVKVIPETKEDQTISYTAVFQNVEDPLPVPLSDLKDLNLETLPKEAPQETIKEADKQPDKATPKQTIPVNLPVDDQKLAIENLCIEAKKESKSIDDFISILATKDVKVIPETKEDQTISYTAVFQNVEDPLPVPLSDLKDLNLETLPKEAPQETIKEADKQPDKATPKQTIPVNLSVDDQKLAIENLCIEAKKESKSIEEFIGILATKDVKVTAATKEDQTISYTAVFQNVEDPLPVPLSDLKDLNLETLQKEESKSKEIIPSDKGLALEPTPKEPTKTTDKQPEIKTHSVPQQAVILKRLMLKAAKEMKDVDHFFEILEANNVKAHRNLTAGRVTGYSVEMEGIKDPKVFKSSQIDRKLSIHYLRDSKQTKVIIPFHSSNEKQISMMRDLCFSSKNQAGNIDDFIKELRQNNVQATEIKKSSKVVDYVVKFEKVAVPIPLVLSKLDDAFKLENFTKETPKDISKETSETTSKLPERSPAQQKIILKRLITKAAKESVSVRRFFATLETGNVKVHENLTAGKVTGYSVELKNVKNPIKFKSSEVDRSLTLHYIEKSIQEKDYKKELIEKLEDTFSRARDLNHLEKLLGSRGVKLYPIKVNNKVINYTMEYKNKSFPSKELPPKYSSYSFNDHFKLQNIVNSPANKIKRSYTEQKQVLFLGIKSAFWNSRNIDSFAKRLSELNIGIEVSGDDYILRNKNSAQPISIPISDIDKKFNAKTIPFMLENNSKDGAYQSSEKQIDHLKNVCFQKVDTAKTIDEFIKSLELENIKVTPKKEGGKVVDYTLLDQSLVNPFPFGLKEVDQSLTLDSLQGMLERNNKSQISESDQKILLEKAIIDSITLSTSVDFDSFFEDLQKNDFEVTPISRDGKLADFEITNNNLANPIKIKASQVREEFSVENFLEVFESRAEVESKGQAFQPQTGNAPSLGNSLMSLLGSALSQGGGDGNQQAGQQRGKSKKKKQNEEEERGRGFEM